MRNQECPIGVFDSGVGGISTLREMARLLPNEDFIFYGDSVNAPYGEKSADEVVRLSRAAVEELRAHQVKAIVIACNTATSAAKPELMNLYSDIPILGIEPALKLAVDRGKSTILVMATPLTLSRPKFRAQVERFSASAAIHSLPCPGLADLIEHGPEGLPSSNAYLHDLLEPINTATTADSPLDAVVLGCTHYPFIADEIRKHLSGTSAQAQFYTGYEGLTRNLIRHLKSRNLLRPERQTGDERTVTFLSSRDTPEELALYQRLFAHGFEG